MVNKKLSPLPPPAAHTCTISHFSMAAVSLVLAFRLLDMDNRFSWHPLPYLPPRCLQLLLVVCHTDITVSTCLVGYLTIPSFYYWFMHTHALARAHPPPPACLPAYHRYYLPAYTTPTRATYRPPYLPPHPSPPAAYPPRLHTTRHMRHNWRAPACLHLPTPFFYPRHTAATICACATTRFTLPPHRVYIPRTLFADGTFHGGLTTSAAGEPDVNANIRLDVGHFSPYRAALWAACGGFRLVRWTVLCQFVVCYDVCSLSLDRPAFTANGYSLFGCGRVTGVLYMSRSRRKGRRAGGASSKQTMWHYYERL